LAASEAHVERVSDGERPGVLHDRALVVGDDAVAPIEHAQRVQVPQTLGAGVDALRGRRGALGRRALPAFAAPLQIGA
jgi:hypothetical protein